MSKVCNDPRLERLAILSEELGEAQQAIGKILRHGWESTHPNDPQGPSNRKLLERELGDVFAAVTLLARANDIAITVIELRERDKFHKIQPYLHCGDNQRIAEGLARVR